MAYRRGLLAGLALALIGVSACVGGGANNNATLLHAQASAELARWDEAAKSAGGGIAFVPTSDTTLMVGDDWGSGIDGGAAKIAMMSNYFKSVITLPTDTPADAEIRWPDGTTLKTPVLSAKQAFDEMSSNGTACSECTLALTVTGAKLTTATFDTSRGKASAPAWEFTLADTPVKMARVAVAAQTITVSPPPWDPYNAPVGLAIDSATIDSTGTVLTAHFVGAEGGADKPCGADYTAEAVESETAVVVIVYKHANGLPVACSAVGYFRTAPVTLAKPLGNRAVLEVQTGRPVPVTHE